MSVAVAHRELSRGSYVGPYRLESRLGQGGCAEVWLAVEEGPLQFKKRVALKLLLPDRSLASVESLANEARICALMRHPGLVDVYRVDEADGTWYVAMEYVQGSDLAGLLCEVGSRGLAMPLSVALEVAASIADALAYAHSACDFDGRPLKLVHRDLKPANVLVGRDGAVKVSDFGLAKTTSSDMSTTAGALKGTPCYMAPEVWAGVRDFRPGVDLFALGAMIFEMVLGRRLLAGDTTAALATQAVLGDADAEAAQVEAVMPGLGALVRELLARDPLERVQDAEHVASRLRSLVDGLPRAGDLRLFLRLLRTADMGGAERAREAASLGPCPVHDPRWQRAYAAARRVGHVGRDPGAARPAHAGGCVHPPCTRRPGGHR